MKLFTISVFYVRWIKHTFDFLFPSLTGLMLGTVLSMLSAGLCERHYAYGMLCLAGIIVVLAVATGKWLAEKESCR